MALPTAAFEHRALRYTSAAGFLGGTVPYLREGLREGDCLLVVTTPQNRDLLCGALGGDAAAVEFADAETWYDSPARTLAAYHRYVGDRTCPPRRVRVVGEPLWPGRSSVQLCEWTRYESLVNVALADTGARLLCPYNAVDLDPWVLDAAARTHPEMALDAGDPTDSERYTDPETFTAQCDARPLSPAPPHARELDFGHGDLAMVRAFAEVCARHAALGPARGLDLVFATNEVATNALSHGGGRGKLLSWRTDDTLVLQVTDEGSGARGAPFPGHLPADPTTRSGHGLWAVRQLCDLLQVRLRPDGSTVRLTYCL
ncbi:hypothetical protein AQ490_00595 [Wenjunlia vitaminophila]|uniref:Sensor histidine kinase n=1 Tax=Wenjunlia vitaminophila TaxID=76728 RepID=A0A0T6LZB3_WENVI|nr:sensor histidine kinase [Wenjunlia vitaminophila]KRV51305.1 hypothetical protein AQ490_00595 [Wenjunlia vitaminophila]